MTQQNEREYCTYSVFDPDIQQFIYVGLTSNFERRIKQHKKSSPWWRADLIFATMDTSIGSYQKGREREKYWIGRYYDEGHPLKNSNDIPNSAARWELDLRQYIANWLRDASNLSPEQKEQVADIWVKAGDGMEWNFMYNKVNSIAGELEKTHHITLTILDISRLTAIAEGLDINNEETK